MSKHFIKYYPVDNGDTSFIKLKDETTILLDCNIREGKTNSDGNNIYDVKKDLLDCINKRNKNPYIDVFVLSHPDEDHCLGFKKNFYTGDPKDYDKDNRENDEIIIDEIWVTSMLFTYKQCNDANAIRNEVNRRIKLWDDDDTDKNKAGNRIKLVGYDSDDKFKNVDKYIPGTIVKKINNQQKKDFSFFIHAPFKDDLIDGKAEKDRNSTSIILQARFKEKETDTDFSCRAFFGGDSDHYIWEKVLEKTKKHKNEDALKWDLFLAPHHCSWTYFNNVPYDDEGNEDPKQYSLEILDYGETGCKVISSSKKIKKEKPNPPHKAAKDEYIKKLSSKDNFYNTSINSSEKNPKPIVFETSQNGPRIRSAAIGSALTSAGGSSNQVNSPSTHG